MSMPKPNTDDPSKTMHRKCSWQEIQWRVFLRIRNTRYAACHVQRSYAIAEREIFTLDDASSEAPDYASRCSKGSLATSKRRRTENVQATCHPVTNQRRRLRAHRRHPRRTRRASDKGRTDDGHDRQG